MRGRIQPDMEDIYNAVIAFSNDGRGHVGPCREESLG